MYKLELSEL